jgi:hypothetical protein
MDFSRRSNGILVAACLCGKRQAWWRLRLRGIMGKSVQQGEDAGVRSSDSQGNRTGNGEGNNYCDQ